METTATVSTRAITADGGVVREGEEVRAGVSFDSCMQVIRTDLE